MTATTRRDFLKHCMVLGAAMAGAVPLRAAADKPGSHMRFGMVTYQWGKDWDLPTLIANCAQTGVLGVELRTTHAHGVEPGLSAQ